MARLTERAILETVLPSIQYDTEKYKSDNFSEGKHIPPDPIYNWITFIYNCIDNPLDSAIQYYSLPTAQQRQIEYKEHLCEAFQRQALNVVNGLARWNSLRIIKVQ